MPRFALKRASDEDAIHLGALDLREYFFDDHFCKATWTAIQALFTKDGDNLKITVDSGYASGEEADAFLRAERDAWDR